MDENEVKEFVNENTDMLTGLGVLAGLLYVTYKLGKANGKTQTVKDMLKLVQFKQQNK